MGKRGPQPKPEEAKSAALSARLTAVTRARLVDAAEKNGRSISQELEARLVRSFDSEGDLTITKNWGSRETYALMRLASLAVRRVEGFTGASWHKDVFTRALACEAIIIVAEAVKPIDSADPPNSFPNLPDLENWPEHKESLRDVMKSKSTRELLYPLVIGEIAIVKASTATTGEALKAHREVAHQLRGLLPNPPAESKPKGRKTP